MTKVLTYITGSQVSDYVRQRIETTPGDSVGLWHDPEHFDISGIVEKLTRQYPLTGPQPVSASMSSSDYIAATVPDKCFDWAVERSSW